MKTVVVAKDNTDYTRDVVTYLTDFKRQTGHDLQVIDPNSPGGISFCQAYDIVEYPTMIALSDDGVMQNIWRGLPLPTISEVSYYV